jgi:hypothetical protein
MEIDTLYNLCLWYYRKQFAEFNLVAINEIISIDPKNRDITTENISKIPLYREYLHSYFDAAPSRDFSCGLVREPGHWHTNTRQFSYAELSLPLHYYGKPITIYHINGHSSTDSEGNKSGFYTSEPKVSGQFGIDILEIDSKPKSVVGIHRFMFRGT